MDWGRGESNSGSPCFVSSLMTTTYVITFDRCGSYDQTTSDHSEPLGSFEDRIYWALTEHTGAGGEVSPAPPNGPGMGRNRLEVRLAGH